MIRADRKGEDVVMAKKKILIVDDLEHIRKILSFTLNKHGFHTKI